MSLRRVRMQGPRRQRGIALVLALWITILLTAMASSFAYTMRTEALAARNSVSLAQAEAIADGAVERTAFELLRPRNIPDAVWLPDGRTHTWREDDAQVRVLAVDESARIDINTAPPQLLTGLLQNVGELSPDEAQNVVDAILDWRDSDDLRRPHGAEEPEYRAAGRKYRPTNGPFEAVADLRLVLGMTPAVFERIAPALTVFSRLPGINPGTAPRQALLALPAATPEAVDAYLAQRKDALEQKLPVPPFAPAQPFATGISSVWRIRAEVVMNDGVTFVRDAVVRPSSDPRRGAVALVWQQGTQLQNASDAAPSKDNGTANR